jgi:hypothetical protein
MPQAFDDSDFCLSDHSDVSATKSAAKPTLTWDRISKASV